MATDNVYVIGGITNAFSDPTDPFDDSFDRLFNDNELFKSLEIGWTSWVMEESSGPGDWFAAAGVRQPPVAAKSADAPATFRNSRFCMDGLVSREGEGPSYRGRKPDASSGGSRP